MTRVTLPLMNLQISWGEVFEEIDESGDGRVTKDELKAQYIY